MINAKSSLTLTLTQIVTITQSNNVYALFVVKIMIAIQKQPIQCGKQNREANNENHRASS